MCDSKIYGISKIEAFTYIISYMQLWQFTIVMALLSCAIFYLIVGLYFGSWPLIKAGVLALSIAAIIPQFRQV
jgi:hypothetical protein